MIQTNEQKLLDEFIKMTKKEWIKSINNSSGNIGITFENELSNKENSSFLPDYHGIEIKCSNKYSVYPITLFSQCHFLKLMNIHISK